MEKINPRANSPKPRVSPAAGNTSPSRPPAPQESYTIKPDSDFVRNLNLPRPDSPTLDKLYRLALKEEIEGTSPGPFRPSETVPMSKSQAKAAHKFKDLLGYHDSDKEKRKQGEFGAAFNGRKSTVPMRYAPGGGVELPMSMPEGTTHIIHSHPALPSGLRNDYPSAGDYYTAYLTSRGNSNGIQGEMLYHPSTDQFFGFEGKVNPATGMPAYRRLTLPDKKPSSHPPDGG